MKKIASFLIITLSVVITINAQIFKPVKWSTSVEKISDSEYYLVAKATIDKGWHLYSQNIPKDGPIPTAFTFNDSIKSFQLIGKPIEGKGHELFDKVFNMHIKYFEHQAIFKQRIKLLTDKKIVVDGTVEYMVCDDTSCLPPTDVDLTFSLQGKSAIPSVVIQKNQKKGQAIVKSNEQKIKINKSPNRKNKSLLTLFLLSFLAGFAALLTPCVFPMIPMTVSFFTKQSKTKAIGFRNALIYGISIIIIYVFLGTVITSIFGADSLNALSTNVWFNLIFFLLLVIFAISFLGAFEIMLPNSWANIMDKNSERSGFIGIFFMALALAIVSFSCTGPIVGTALVAAASVGGVGPVISMLGFSLALALPFTLFAAFPGWLNSLPKSGGWLNTVKVFLGFVELAFAFKFLSNADLVLNLHWLERETFLAIWIGIFGTLAFYLFGKIKLPHDSDLDYISVGRLSLGMIVLIFTIYMIPGLWGAPLKLISGFPPPMKYSESPYGVGFTKLGASGMSSIKLPKDAHLGPHDIVSFLDYDKGMAYAKKVGKPVMLDFTGKACVNCRKMEERVWSDEKVLNILKNKIVLISLFVDDKRSLPKNEQYVSKITGSKIKNIGNKWSEFEIINYKANAQPYYVLINHKGEKLNEPTAYTPSVTNYLNWLHQGIKNFSN